MKLSHSLPLSLQPSHCTRARAAQRPHEQWEERIRRLRSFGSSLDPPALVTTGLYGRSIRPPVRTCCGTPTQNTPVRQEVTEVIAHAALGSTSEKNTMQIPLYCYQPADTGTCFHLRIYFIPIQNNLNQLSQSRRL